MIVKELIELLNKMPQDKTVCRPPRDQLHDLYKEIENVSEYSRYGTENNQVIID